MITILQSLDILSETILQALEIFSETILQASDTFLNSNIKNQDLYLFLSADNRTVYVTKTLMSSFWGFSCVSTPLPFDFLVFLRPCGIFFSAMFLLWLFLCCAWQMRHLLHHVLPPPMLNFTSEGCVPI